MRKRKNKPGVEPKHIGGAMNKAKSINLNPLHLSIALAIEKTEKKKVGEFLVDALLRWDIEKNNGAIAQKYIEKSIDNVHC